MSCHTWFHKKIERSEGQAEVFALQRCDIAIDVLKDCIRNNDFCMEPIDDVRMKQLLRDINFFERCKSFIQKGLFKTGHWGLQPESNSEYIRSKGYFVTSSEGELPHDIFRIGNYPNDKLFSMKETLAFCNKKSVKLSKIQKEKLEKFWNEYSDGMIDFG